MSGGGVSMREIFLFFSFFSSFNIYCYFNIISKFSVNFLIFYGTKEKKKRVPHVPRHHLKDSLTVNLTA